MFNRILVVCTGNICRSPIAEGLLKAALPKATVTSAGTAAVVGAPADPHSEQVCKDHGVALGGHIARQITPSMLQESDLVLALDASHQNWINARFPQYRGKVHKLGKWQSDQDVPDPYMHPIDAFEQCYLQIDKLVGDWAKRI